MTQKVALIGGSFDPIHVGHLLSARAVAEQVGLDRVVFLPAGRPPHKKEGELTQPALRAEMVRLAIEGESGFAFSDFDLARHGPTYTLDTVTHFAGAWGPGVALYWIIGADSFAELAGWHRVRDLVAACRILTAARPGFEDLEAPALRAAVGEAKFEELRDGILSTPRIDVSSTQIRERVRLGRSIRYLVPETVLRFIESHQLYRSPSPQRR